MSARRRLLWVTVALAAAITGAWVLASAWLESSGGRQVLTAALEKRLGMTVALQGDFDIAVLPRPGVSGTDLIIGQVRGEQPFATVTRFRVEVGLRELLQRRLLIEQVVLSDGTVYPERYQRPISERPATTGAPPEIRMLRAEDIRLMLPGGGGSPLHINSVALSEFAPGRATPFEVRIEAWGTLRGDLAWDPLAQQARLSLVWQVPDAGELELGGDLVMATRSGRVEARFLPAWSSLAVQLDTHYAYGPEAVDLYGLVIEAGGQQISGTGCVRLSGGLALALELQAEQLDLDAWQDLLPPAGTEGGDGPLPLNLTLEVNRLVAGGAAATGVTLRVGATPDCSPAAASPPGP
jgi:autotransporter translocation and assembly factor TamB